MIVLPWHTLAWGLELSLETPLDALEMVAVTAWWWAEQRQRGGCAHAHCRLCGGVANG